MPKKFSDQFLIDMAGGSKNPEVLRKLSGHRGRPAVIKAVAGNKFTPRDTVDKIAMSYDSDDFVAAEALQNPNVSQHVLDSAAEGRGPRLAATAARHPRTSPHVLAKLTKHPDRQVVLNAARNKYNAPPALKELLQHKDPEVVSAAIANPSTPREDFLSLVDHPNPKVKRELARTLHTPPEVHRKLFQVAKEMHRAEELLSSRRRYVDHSFVLGRDWVQNGSPGWNVLYDQAGNENAPDDVLTALSKYPYFNISHAAKMTMSRKGGRAYRLKGTALESRADDLIRGVLDA